MDSTHIQLDSADLAYNVPNTSWPGYQKWFFERNYHSFIWFTTVGAVICLFSVASNVICLVAIFTYPPLQRGGNLLVANLVLVNVLLSITVHPVSIASVMYRQYHPLPLFFCDWMLYCTTITYSFLWHECFLAINRFIAIVFPHSYNHISSKSAIIFTIALGYLIPFLLSLYPYLLKRPVYVTSLPYGACVFSLFYHDTIIPPIQQIVGVYLPLVLIGIFYVTLFGRTWSEKRRLSIKLRNSEEIGNQGYHMKRNRTRLARMLFFGFIWNLISYIPQPLFTYFFISYYIRHPTTFFYVRWVLQLGAAGNTIVYAICHRHYRNGILSVLRCACSRIPRSTGSSTVDQDLQLCNTGSQSPDPLQMRRNVPQWRYRACPRITGITTSSG